MICKTMNKIIIGMGLYLSLLLSSAQGAIEAYEFDNEDQQRRFYQLADELRCPRCLNTNLAGSDAPIALDLRAEVYDQIRQGRTNREIVAFMRERYGDFITYRPPLNSGTILLWFGPLAFLVFGLIVVFRMSRSKQSNNAQALSPEEQNKLKSLLSSRSE